MSTRICLASILVAAAILLTACGGTAMPQGQPTFTPAGATPLPTRPIGGGIGEPGQYDVVVGLAQVEEVTLLVLESFPVQVNVRVKGNLPDGCTKIDRIDGTRQSNRFDYTITTLRPASAACTEALVPFEQTFRLDVLGLKAGTYAVTVNGVSTSLELTMDNVLSTP